MPTLVTQDDGTVRWDYDVEGDKPKKKPAKKAAPAAESKES
jgi:hypothetical protein